MLQVSASSISWWMRSKEQIAFINENNHNPKYLSSVLIEPNNVFISNDLKTIVQNSELIIIAVPSAFIHDTFTVFNASDFINKTIVSAVKGIIPQPNLLPALYFEQQFKVLNENIAIIAGPCHAEEVAMDKLSYLTFACQDQSKAKALATLFSSKFIKTCYSSDMLGIELSAVLKNVYAISAGICHGLGYGDNFIAVLISNCIKELEVFLSELYPTNRTINSTQYLGDLLVTSYSLHSRNRRFGNLIGRGYSVKAAENEMNMVAEGYYASKCINQLKLDHSFDSPIADAVFAILHNKQSPKSKIKQLSALIT